MLLHPDRYATGAPTHKNGVVIHDSEGVEGGTASASLIRALGAKGDRISANGHVYGAGYQAVATETGGYTIVADDNVGPYHAGAGINPCMWSICIPGKASQTRAQWLGDVSREYIRGAAHYIVDMWNHDGHVWPLAYRTGAQLAADKANLRDHPTGYTSHHEVTVSKLTSTTHYDPGPNFPFDVLAADIAALTQTAPPPVTPPMPPASHLQEEELVQLSRKNGRAAIWLGNRIIRTHVTSMDQLDQLIPVYGQVVLLDETADLTTAVGAIVVGADPGDI